MISNYLIFVLVIIICSIIIDYYKTKDIFSIANIFNFFALHYFFVGINLYNYEYNFSNYKIIEEISLNVVLVLLAFNITYQITPYRIKNYQKTKFNINLMYFLFFLLFVIDIILILDNKIIFGIDRTQNFQILYDNKLIFLKEGIQNLVYLIVIYDFYTNKTKTRFNAHLLFTIYMVLFSFVTISRFQIFLVIFPHIYFLYKERKLSAFSIIIGYFISAFIFLFWKPFLYTYILGLSFGAEYNYSELFNWLKNSITIMSYSNLYEYNSYLLTIEGLFNPFNDSSLAPTNWFMDNFYYNKFVGGNRLGFSGIAEGFINGSLNYNIFVFGFYGFLFKKLNFSKKPVFIVTKIIVIILIFKLFRSESYNFFRNIAWYYFYPLILISFFNKIKFAPKNS